jgi:Bacterial CdiA-CT RNAse A domain
VRVGVCADGPASAVKSRVNSRLRLLGTLWLALAVGLGHLACRPDPSASAPPRADAAASPPVEARQAPAAQSVPERYDLARDEARGGHTLVRHVGRSDADLKERLRREPSISAASTYSDRVIAERVVARALARNRARVDQWLARPGSRPNLTLDYRGDAKESIGRSLSRRNSQPVTCSDAVVVLRWDGRKGFIVLTSYPESRR